MRATVFFIIYISLTSILFGQNINVTGVVTNKETGETLPFSNLVSLPSNMGIATDENGAFDLQFNKTQLNDTLIVSFIGFESLKLSVSQLKPQHNIELVPLSETLDEFVLTPLTAHDFMKMVVSSIPKNTPSTPFSALGFYSDKAKEGNGFLGENEAVIKSYFPNISDTTIQNQHQVVLYNERKDLAELKFMAKKLKKEEEKERKKLAKKGNDSTEVDFMNPREMFGGLDEVMKNLTISGDEAFLDTINYKKYDFQFNDKPIYTDEGKEITLIHAKTIRRNEGFKASGKIYIDRESLAIIKMDFTGDLKIPLIIRPVLFVMGIGIEKPKLHYARNFVKKGELWYPKNIFYTINLKLTEKKIFKKNITSNFKIQQAFHIQSYTLTDSEEIVKEKRYTPKKTLAEQVHPEKNIHWNMINKIKF